MAVQTNLLHDSVFDHPETCKKQLQLFQQWERTGGYMDDVLFKLRDELVLFGMPSHSSVPPLQVAGRKSLAAQVMGLGWEDDLRKMGETEKFAAPYLRALNGEPAFEQTVFSTSRGGLNFTLAYKRLVIMVRTPRGFPYFVTHSSVDRLDYQPHSAASSKIALDLARPTNNRVLLGSDAEPIATHSPIA